MYITFEIFLANFSFLILLISMLIYWIEASNFSSTSFDNQKIKFGSIGMLISNLSLFLLLTVRWYESGHFPLSNLYESLMFLSLSLTLIHLFIEIVFGLFPIKVLNLIGPLSFNKEKNQSDSLYSENITPKQKRKLLINKLIGSITAPCALFTNAFATFSLPKEMQESAPLVPALQSNWLMMHVTVMILSYSALILGSLLSIGFLVITSKIDTDSKNSFSTNNDYLKNAGLKFSAYSGRLPNGLAPCPPAGMELEQNKIVSNDNQIFESKLNKPSVSVLSFGPLSEQPARKSSAISLEDFPKNDALGAMEGLNRSSSFKENQFKSQVSNNFNVKSVTDVWKSTQQEQNNRLNLAKILDNLSYRILGLGFPLLTIGILSGAVWANEAWGSYWSWDPKETWALLTWLVFAIYLHTRLTKGWEGKKPALIASLGFVTVWVCFLGVNLIGEGLHSYGWLS
jgi:ABC-type transport system involved in cytochrome c biogenesis permease subunit